MGEKQLSSVETELYDRQIRLWGIESQEKLRAANVLLLGVKGLGSEVTKNIVLSGINALTIADDELVTEHDLAVNFLLTPDCLGKKLSESILLKAQALNPLVKLSVESNINDKKEDYFKNFQIVVATGLQMKQILTISEWCRKNKVKFICGDVFGMFGCTISDLQDHDYYEDRVKLPKKRAHSGKSVDAEMTTVKIHALIKYPSLKRVLKYPEDGKPKKCRNIYFYLMLALLEFRDKFNRNVSRSKQDEDVNELKKMFESLAKKYEIDSNKLDENVFELLFGEVVPICSVVGGVIAQEVIKAVSGKEVPINNVFILNPLNYSGKEETICN
ncbi:SUMO-activating enzyme subunit 1 [Onthophagus taurus]|uniref:SUMO-activating enzyme subunit 1 n=1 Tax=Onthophagus taurus TaxID=166361 RepID=UPI000C202EF1|nr:SUMO-activating enzyme subunit 1 [Onthophagus taurus]